ncbi:MAG: aminotransferase class I/II-fold pyridoxal phosphate-dependent enzyme [Ruminococcaceae bacterium]|nr:aminotransferase class I/II-fold pyridoxal phosphate-dependent enzyme [Oscillospiraceae bacterium]
MKSYGEMDKKERESLLEKLNAEYASYKERGMKLDMSRGKPSSEQLDLSLEIFNQKFDRELFTMSNGMDARNYGVPTGIPEMKSIFAEMLNVSVENVIVGGNSSLNLEYDFISRAYTHGVYEGAKPWKDCGKLKWLCPSPGYDRHFAITELFGFELVTIPMTENGPDMDAVERLVATADTIKGIWCVPVYSNPTGAVYSDETIKRLASMKCKAEDFVIMYDNAYCVHHLYDKQNKVISILKECETAGNPERVVLFTSTSKITFAGAGVCCVAGSKKLLSAILNNLSIQTIGFDKTNQILHAKFLKNLANVNEHMKKQADIVRPKFEAVIKVLDETLGGLGISDYIKPQGGYFINLVTPKGTAKRIVSLCAEAGVKLTPAGAMFPYGNDPDDCNIRIAPTYPSSEEITLAAKLLSLCTRIAALEVLNV